MIFRQRYNWQKTLRDALSFKQIFKILLTWALALLLIFLLGELNTTTKKQQESWLKQSSNTVTVFAASPVIQMGQEEDNLLQKYPTKKLLERKVLPTKRREISVKGAYAEFSGVVQSYRSNSSRDGGGGRMLSARQNKDTTVMIDKTQIRYLIRRVLKEADLWSQSAEELLMMTAAVESRLGTYIRQVGGGPALGIFQMEPATHNDIWTNYLDYNHKVRDVVHNAGEDADALEYNLAYAILMTRAHYLRVKEKLPDHNDHEALAKYWKTYYNTKKGKGTIEKALDAYYLYC